VSEQLHRRARRRRGDYTTITVRSSTKRLLEDLKKRLRAETWDDLVSKLATVVEEWQEVKLRTSVKAVVCNDLKEARASLAAWVRLLASKLSNAAEVSLALEYLRPSEGDTYSVDLDKCVER